MVSNLCRIFRLRASPNAWEVGKNITIGRRTEFWGNIPKIYALKLLTLQKKVREFQKMQI